ATPRRSEVPDDIGGKHGERVRPGVVEGFNVERIIPTDLRTEGDAWREPVLPADGEVQVFGLKAGALAVEVVEQLGTPGDVVHGRDLVVEVGEHRPFLGGAVLLPEVAVSLERRVAHAEERCADVAAPGNVDVGHVVLMDVPGLPGEVPVLVELV